MAAPAIGAILLIVGIVVAITGSLLWGIIIAIIGLLLGGWGWFQRQA